MTVESQNPYRSATTEETQKGATRLIVLSVILVALVLILLVAVGALWTKSRADLLRARDAEVEALELDEAEVRALELAEEPAAQEVR